MEENKIAVQVQDTLKRLDNVEYMIICRLHWREEGETACYPWTVRHVEEVGR
jgi:hypothetical protein